MSPADAAAAPTPEEIRHRLAVLDLAVTPEQAAQLAGFVALLLKWNRVYNLTGVRGAEEILDRHLVESFALRTLLEGHSVADVGTGAGLPGVPLAIVEPARHFTLIESRAKRVRFLRHVASELALRNITVAHSRAEDLPVTQPFATVLARAVAPPAELLAICRHLTAPGSRLVLLTAPHLQETFRGLAADWVWRPPPSAGPRLKSAIVCLERTDG